MSFSKNHAGKVVLITGASDGLGLEAAKNYAKAQFTTVMTGRSAEKLAKAAEAVRLAASIDASQADEKIYTICFDFSSLKSVRNGVTQFLDLKLPLNMLINNAGMFGSSHEFTKDSNVFEKTIMVNMVGPLLFTELLLPKMKESEGGKILIVSSSMHLPKKVDIENFALENQLTKLRN
jgi:NAD(P)-dependent dehydrogenase (short-subunit alcohol dehydrogenase family)